MSAPPLMQSERSVNTSAEKGAAASAVNFNGVSERTLVLLIWLPILIVSALVIVSYQNSNSALRESASAKQTAETAVELAVARSSETANSATLVAQSAKSAAENAVSVATLSERNAKLAQFQLEESLKKAGIEVVNPR